MQDNEKIYSVRVDGQDVPTWQLFWEQMMAQSSRIDRAISIARCAILVGLTALVAAIIAIMRCS